MDSIEETIYVKSDGKIFKAEICLTKQSPKHLGTFLPVGWIPIAKRGVVYNWKKIGEVCGPSNDPCQFWEGLACLPLSYDEKIAVSTMKIMMDMDNDRR